MGRLQQARQGGSTAAGAPAEDRWAAGSLASLGSGVSCLMRPCNVCMCLQAQPSCCLVPGGPLAGRYTICCCSKRLQYYQPPLQPNMLLSSCRASAGPQEPAQQPRGFAAGLTLKPHQLQALALMQAAEARPLGFNDVVWREVTLAGRRCITLYSDYDLLVQAYANILPAVFCLSLNCRGQDSVALAMDSCCISSCFSYRRSPAADADAPTAAVLQ